MYFATVLLLLFVLPIISIAVQASLHPHAFTLISLIGRWFVFWAVGIRLLIAGIRQVVQPRFTAVEIFGIQDTASFAIVRELGFANLSMGLLGVLSLSHFPWIIPAAIVGGLYYGFAGFGHVFQKSRNAKENFAMLSDIFVFLVLACFLWKTPIL